MTHLMHNSLHFCQLMIQRLVSSKADCCHLKSLPWQRTTVEVHQHVAKWFHIVTSTLLNTKVSIDTRVPSCASQVFVLTVRYVLPCSVVTVLLRQPIVNQKHLQHNSTFNYHCTISHRLPQFGIVNKHLVYKNFTPVSQHIAIWPTMAKHDVSHKTGST